MNIILFKNMDGDEHIGNAKKHASRVMLDIYRKGVNSLSEGSIFSGILEKLKENAGEDVSSKSKTWRDHFDSLWEGGNEEDMKYKGEIMTFDPKKLKPRFEKVIEVASGDIGRMSFEELAKFKHEMLKFEKKVGEKQVFTWNLGPFGMSVLDSVMKDDPIRYYCVHLWMKKFWGLAQYGWSERQSFRLPDLFVRNEEPHPARPECEDVSCSQCSIRDCLYGNMFHYSSDGCSMCKGKDSL